MLLTAFKPTLSSTATNNNKHQPTNASIQTTTKMPFKVYTASQTNKNHQSTENIDSTINSRSESAADKDEMISSPVVVKKEGGDKIKFDGGNKDVDVGNESEDDDSVQFMADTKGEKLKTGAGSDSDDSVQMVVAGSSTGGGVKQKPADGNESVEMVVADISTGDGDGDKPKAADGDESVEILSDTVPCCKWRSTIGLKGNCSTDKKHMKDSVAKKKVEAKYKVVKPRKVNVEESKVSNNFTFKTF